MHGDVAGTAAIAHALLWPHPLTVNGTISVDITPSGADASATANGINDAGIAVGGYRVDLQHPYHAYVLNGNQESQIAARDDIGMPAGGTTSEAYGINNSGNVVGFSDAGAFYWTPPVSPQPASAGTMVNLNTVITGVPAGDLMDEAKAINDAGAIAGFTHHQDNTYTAWVLTPGSSDGGTPPAAPTNVHATALSNSQVAITFQDASTTETRFQVQRSTSSKFTPSSAVTTLGTLPAHDGTGATLLWVDNSGLAAHKKYYYRVIATGSGGNATSSVASTTTKTTALAFSVSLKAKVGATATGHLAVVNPLSVALPLVVPAAAATAPFTITPSGTVTVPAGGATSLTVTFHPTAKGTVTVHTTLALDANANPDPQVAKLFPIPVTLSGQGK